MRHFSRHPDTLAQCGVRVNGFEDVYRISTHLNGQRNPANHVACSPTGHAAARDFAVAVLSGSTIKH